VTDCPDTILAGNDVATLRIEEPDDLVIPGWFVKTFEQAARDVKDELLAFYR
jgi:hypothetical protein